MNFSKVQRLPMWGRFFYLLMFLTCAVLYFPGLSGDFLFDDFSNIVSRGDLHIERFEWETFAQLALSGDAGPLKRPIAVLSFALNHLFFGLNPWYFKLVNLGIHLVNGILFFAISRLLFLQLSKSSAVFLAWLATTIWLLHPLNVSTVLYVVQRMTILSAFFMLLGIWFYLTGRKSFGGKKWLLIFSGLLCTVPAALSKENGLLLPGFLFLIEWLVLKFNVSSSEKIKLQAFFTVFVFFPFLIAIIWLWFNFDFILAGYENRQFTIGERLMTEAMVLWFYLKLFFLPNLSEMGLFHEDFPISSGFFSPPTTFLSVFGLIGLIFLAFVFRKVAPIVALGVFWFFYGHSMESSIVPLDLVYEHRNYFPIMGLSLISAYAVGQIPDRLRTFSIIVLVALFSTLTFIRSSIWGNTQAHMLVEVENHPDSPATLYEAGRVVLRLAEQSQGKNDNYFLEQSLRLFHAAAERGNVGGYYALIMIKSAIGDDYDNEFMALAESLINSAIDPINYFILPELVRCYYDNRCKVRQDEIVSLYSALLSNKRLNGRNRAIILNQMAYFLFAQGDLDSSINFAKEAIDVLPNNGCSYLAMIDLYRLSGDRENARMLLQLADQKGVSQCIGAFRNLRKSLGYEEN